MDTVANTVTEKGIFNGVFLFFSSDETFALATAMILETFSSLQV